MSSPPICESHTGYTAHTAASRSQMLARSCGGLGQGGNDAFAHGAYDLVSRFEWWKQHHLVNASLLKEMRSIALLKQLIDGEGRAGQRHRQPLFKRVQDLRVHLIDGGESLSPLGAASKTETQWAFLSRLHDLGHASASRWLTEHGHHLGERSSFDLAGVLEG